LIERHISVEFVCGEFDVFNVVVVIDDVSVTDEFKIGVVNEEIG
jgi:hypothetical protein